MLDENQLYAVTRYAIISYFAKHCNNEESNCPIKLHPDDFTSVMNFVKRNYKAYIKLCDLNYDKEI